MVEIIDSIKAFVLFELARINRLKVGGRARRMKVKQIKERIAKIKAVICEIQATQ